MYAYEYGFLVNAGSVGFSILDLPSLAGWYEPDDTETTNALLAADFVTANSEFLSSASTDFDFGNEDFTLGCWVKFDNNGTNQPLIGKWNFSSSNASYLIRRSTTNEMVFFISNDGSTLSSITHTDLLTSGVWYFVVAVYDSINELIKVSIDGGAFQTSSYSLGAYSLSNEALNIARQNHNTPGSRIYSDMAMDSPFFYDKALSLSQVKALYNSGSGVDYSNILDLNGTQFAIAQDYTSASNQYHSSTSTDFDVSGSFSFGCWFKIDTFPVAGNHRLMNKDSNTSRSFVVYIQNTANELGFGLTQSDLTQINFLHGTTLSTGTWYFMTYVADFENGLLKASLNGGAFVTSAFDSTINSSTALFTIGNGWDLTTAFAMDGQVDSPFFYDKALSQSEVNALYNSGSGVAYSGLTTAQKTNLVSWWEMNTVEGANQVDSHGTNNLTPNNDPVSTIGKVNDTTIANIDTSLVSWWTLNEQSGNRSDAHGTNTLTDNNTVGSATGKIQEDVINSGDSVYTEIDKSGNGNHAVQSTVVNQFTWDGSKSLVGNGSTRNLNLDTLQTALAGDTVGYFGGWFKPVDGTPVSAGVLMGFCDTSSTSRCYFQINTDGTLRFVLWVGGASTIVLDSDNVVFADNTWAHVLIVQDGVSGKPKFYFNGVEIATTDTGTGTGDEWMNNAPLIDNGRISCRNIAGGGDSTHFDGLVGQIVAGSSDLTPSQVLAIYNDKKSIYV